jgi:C5HC2 zinc finger
MSHDTKVKLREAFTRFYREEKRARDNIERLLRNNRTQNAEQFDFIELMKDRDSVAEDANQCFYCTDFAYMSMIHCKHHKINYCINHSILCHCPADQVKLIYRYSTKELDQMDRHISEACKKS